MAIVNVLPKAKKMLEEICEKEKVTQMSLVSRLIEEYYCQKKGGKPSIPVHQAVNTKKRYEQLTASVRKFVGIKSISQVADKLNATTTEIYGIMKFLIHNEEWEFEIGKVIGEKFTFKLSLTETKTLNSKLYKGHQINI